MIWRSSGDAAEFDRRSLLRTDGRDRSAGDRERTDTMTKKRTGSSASPLGLAVLVVLGWGYGCDDPKKAPGNPDGNAGDVRPAGDAANGTGGATTCPAGKERCACYGNGTCDAPFTCISQVCVKWGGDAAVATGSTPGNGGFGSGGGLGKGGSGGVGSGGMAGRDASAGGGGAGGNGGTGGNGAPPCPTIYSDKGTPAGTATWTWPDSKASLPAGSFDGVSVDCDTAPEGTTCFKSVSGANTSSGTNYAGWGVFANSNSNWDLSACTRLLFCAQADGKVDRLKVELQADSNVGQKYTYYQSITPGPWQPITITKDKFAGGKLANLFGAFLVTVEGGGQTFRIDNVRWDNGSDSIPSNACQGQSVDASVPIGDAGIDGGAVDAPTPIDGGQDLDGGMPLDTGSTSG
jgi:hypothetical protein